MHGELRRPRRCPSEPQIGKVGPFPDTQDEFQRLVKSISSQLDRRSSRLAYTMRTLQAKGARQD